MCYCRDVEPAHSSQGHPMSKWLTGIPEYKMALSTKIVKLKTPYICIVFYCSCFHMDSHFSFERYDSKIGSAVVFVHVWTKI